MVARDKIEYLFDNANFNKKPEFNRTEEIKSKLQTQTYIYLPKYINQFNYIPENI